jgi:1-acyl-sn-glycerol-3-phosphate acyltransferase
MFRESFAAKHLRRVVSIPGLFSLVAADLALLPFLLTHSAVSDLRNRRPWLLSRFHVAMSAVLVWHVVGLGLLGTWWVAGGWFAHSNQPRWRRWNRFIEGWWGSRIIWLAEVIYGMRVEVRGHEHLVPGPVVVLSRHTSILDTMLPLRVVEHWHDMTARIIKKRVLLWDPCVDSISRRLPRAFVRRSGQHDADLAAVRAVAAGMGQGDVLWMFPEGTRFTHGKRRQILRRLERTNRTAARRAAALKYTLPPRAGGALALLDACRGMDVVFCVHTGLECANRLEDFVNGSLYRRRVQVEFWRVPAAEIPEGEQARLAWLHTWWQRMDRWVQEHQDPDVTEMLRAADRAPASAAEDAPPR